VEHYSTAVVTDSKRLAYWSDVVSETFTGLGITPLGGDPFKASLTRTNVGHILVSNPTSTAARVVHTKSHTARLDERCALVHLQMEGSCEFIQKGSTVVLNNGDFVIADTARPYKFSLSADHRMLVIRVPMESLGAWQFEAERMLGTKILGSQPGAKLLSGYLATLWSELLKAPTSCLPERLVAKTLLDLIEIACTPYGRGIHRPLRRDATRDSVVQFIDDRIYDPKLSVGMIAASLKLTPRYIQKLFSRIETTPGRYICSSRLRAAAQRLRDPGEINRSITEIAFAVGFNDLSHFGRLFKSKHDQTPAEYRRRALAL
jgi:AraC-like DNA-binding protein